MLICGPERLGDLFVGEGAGTEIGMRFSNSSRDSKIKVYVDVAGLWL